MRRIAVIASLLCCIGLVACDDNKQAVQTAQPTVQLPLPAPVAQLPQQTPIYTETRRQRSRSQESSDDSFYENDSESSYSESYSESDSDEYARDENDTIEAHDRDHRKRAVAHVWNDGFGREHASTSGTEQLYADRAAANPINSKNYRDPWYGYHDGWDRK